MALIVVKAASTHIALEDVKSLQCLLQFCRKGIVLVTAGHGFGFEGFYLGI